MGVEMTELRPGVSGFVDIAHHGGVEVAVELDVG